MGIFRVQVNYTFQAVQKWSNVWHVVSADMATIAANVVSVMEGSLLLCLGNACILKSFLLSEDGTDAFFTIDRNSAGLYVDSGSLLPLYNTAKPIFPSADFGRPDLKYLKGIVGENVQTDGILSNALMTSLDSALTDLIGTMDTAATPLCSAEGDLYSTVIIQPQVQMRQMHRKRKKAAPTP